MMETKSLSLRLQGHIYFIAAKLPPKFKPATTIHKLIYCVVTSSTPPSIYTTDRGEWSRTYFISGEPEVAAKIKDIMGL